MGNSCYTEKEKKCMQVSIMEYIIEKEVTT